MSDRLCACGCGCPAARNCRVKRGHLSRLLPMFCACGCGQALEHKSASSGYIAKYKHGHNDSLVGKTTKEVRAILLPNLEKATAKRLLLNTDPEWRKMDSEAKRNGQLRRWSQMTLEEKRQHAAHALACQSEEGRNRWRRGYTFRRAGAHHSQKMQTSWDRKRRDPVAFDKYRQECRERFGRTWHISQRIGPKTWYHTLPSGRRFLVQSSWEAACAESLEAIGVAFQRGGHVVLGDRNWLPDFLIAPGTSGQFYLEVKGHPRARAVFERVQMPRMHLCPLPVYILRCKPPYPLTSDAFVKLLECLRAPV